MHENRIYMNSQIKNINTRFRDALRAFSRLKKNAQNAFLFFTLGCNYRNI